MSAKSKHFLEGDKEVEEGQSRDRTLICRECRSANRLRYERLLADGSKAFDCYPLWILLQQRGRLNADNARKQILECTI
jgi:hypothetical protein